MEKYTYLLLDVGSVLVPFVVSFESRLKFYRSWPALFPALLITAAFFIVWDHYLTLWGVWSFNPKYVCGLWIWGLPIEEWLFFILIPYSCLFIYGSLNTLYPTPPFRKSARNIFTVWFVITSIVALLSYDKLYTGVKVSMSSALLAFACYRNPEWLGKFLRAYLVSLIPFLVVNGVLTALPVVSYNDAENLGIRIFTIPIEDTQYMLLMLLMNTFLFEYFSRQRKAA